MANSKAVINGLLTQRNPRLALIKDYLSVTTPVAQEVIDYYRLYFDIQVDSDYYKSYPFQVLDGVKPSYTKFPKKCSTMVVLADGSRKALGNLESSDVVQNSIPASLTDLLIYKHLLSAKQSIHLDCSFWLHKSAGTTSNWMIIDRDYNDFQNNSMPYVDKVKEDYATMVQVFGVPNIAVTSRGIESGIHFFYLLDNYYPIDHINAYASYKMLGEGLEIKAGVWEIFPKAKTSMPPLPFGMNSRQIIDGVIQPELGVDALLKWYHSKPSMNSIHISSLHLPFANDFVDISIPSLNSSTEQNIHSPITLNQYKQQVDDLLNNPKNYKRQSAQHLLKFHTQIFLGLDLEKSIKYAWQWLNKNIDSEDIQKRPDWAYDNLVKYFTKKQLRFHPSKSKKYSITLNQILALLKDIEPHHQSICSLITPSNARTNGALFSVYSLYIHLHAECIRQKAYNGIFNVRTSYIKQWAGCTNLLYKKARDVLVELKLIEVLQGKYYFDGVGEFRRNCNTFKLNIIHKNNLGDLIELNKESLSGLFQKYLKEEICVAMFGAKGYTSRTYKRKAIEVANYIESVFSKVEV